MIDSKISDSGQCNSAESLIFDNKTVSIQLHAEVLNGELVGYTMVFKAMHAGKKCSSTFTSGGDRCYCILHDNAVWEQSVCSQDRSGAAVSLTGYYSGKL